MNEKIICEERTDEGLRFFKDSCCGTIRTIDGGGDKRVIEVNQIGNLISESNFDNPQRGRVYSSDGISPTIYTFQGGNLEPKIIEPVIVASRGRNPDNPSDRTPGNHVEQRLEPNSEGICNCITSVQKDNMVLESAILTPKRTEYGKAIRKDYEDGKIQESRHNMTELQPRTDGISNTLTTVQKDNLVLEPTVKVKQATKEGYIECKLGGVADLSYPNSKTRRGRVQENGDISPTLTATETGLCRIETPYRIRKLTPLECWRLMSFTDEDFYKAKYFSKQESEELLRKYPNHKGKRQFTHEQRIERMSNSQLYKQAGNSIVVNVLESIFKQML